MAVRPWVAPEDVKGYTDKPNVQARSDAKVKVDIARAELYVIKHTNNRFEDPFLYPEAPESVKLAVILIAEMYGDTAVEGKDKGHYKSESIDDYSYTTADTVLKIDNLDLGPLLDEFVIGKEKTGVTMKLRKL